MYFLRGAFITLIFFAGLFLFGQAQNIFINEVQSSNLNTIFDHTGDTPDWIEIYNGGSSTINLENYGLSDVDSLPLKWTFPAVSIAPQGHMLVYASDLDLKEPILHWETIIDQGDNWKYMVPDAELPSSWKNNGFDDASWFEGKSGFGYGDGDDSTVLESVMSVFLRKRFDVADKNAIQQAYLHIDFDDAFVAYLNGVEIARDNIGQVGIPPAFDKSANNYNHEAAMYSGGLPNEFLLNDISTLLVDGENVLAIQVHNHSTTSSDLTAIPIFTLGHINDPGHEISVSPYINLIPVGLHTNFKISSDGEHIVLSDENGIQIDSVFTDKINADISLGRKPDGNAEWKHFDEPTPGSANNTVGYSAIPMSNVQFSVEGGFYPSSISLVLSSTEPSDSIFYTIDGSEPTRQSSFYTTAITIDKSMTVRARAIASGYLPGMIASNSYLINKSHDLPVVFVNTDPYNLWDYNYGIYVKGPNAQNDFPFKNANFWQDWERPANIAMYETDGSLAFQLDAGIKIFGAYSRGNDQKSLSIHCRKSYGYESINYKIFDDREIDKFKTIILRNSGNDFNNSMLRDGYCNKMLAALELDHQAYRPAVVYLNGEYWGIHNIREKINEEFLAAHHGIDEDNIDILERDGEVVRGNAEHYDALLNYLNTHNLSSTENYEYVKTQLDIDNFIKYQMAQIFIDNRDWPGNNVKFWRERRAGAKWRWILFDLDFALNTWSTDNQSYNTLEFALEPNGPGWPNPPWSTFLLRKLMENESFEYDFINYFADNLNTIFQSSIMMNQLNEIKGAIQNEIPFHMTKWNGGIGFWNDRITAMKTFISKRVGFVRSHIKSEFNLTGTYDIDVDIEGDGYVKLNTIELNSFPWEGIYFNDVPINLEAVPGLGYKFVNWIGVEEHANKEKISVNANMPLQLTAVFEPVDISTTDVVINEINYNSSLDFDPGDWVKLLNISENTINISGWILKDQDDQHEFIFPEGTSIESHGFLVVCRDQYKFLTNFPEVEVVNGELSFGFGSDGDCARLFADTGSLMDIVCYKNDAPWPTEPNGGGSSLALMDALSNNEHPLNWKASKLHGTPGAKNNDIITSLERDELADNITSIKIYPNPIQNIATISVQSNVTENLQISMLDISGRKQLRKKIFFLSEGENLISLNLSGQISGVVSGLYIISLKSNTVNKHIKVIVQ